jgi:hypothetical protein
MHQGLRRRGHVDAFGDQFVEQFGGHVLMVERQRIGPGRHPAQILQVGVRADHHIGGDLCCRLVRRICQHAQGLPKGDSGLMGHPGQLSSADHGHQRGACTRHDHYVVMAPDRRVYRLCR